MAEVKGHGHVDLIFKDGKWHSSHFHLEGTQDLPSNCVVRLVPEKVMTHGEFKEAYPDEAHKVEK